MFNSHWFRILCVCLAGITTSQAQSSLLGDEVHGCTSLFPEYCTVPLTNGGELNSSGIASAIVTDPGVEFSRGSGIVDSADFTADTLTISIKNVNGGVGFSIYEVWAFDNLYWSGTHGKITGLVEQPGGNLNVVSTDFGDDWIIIEFRPAYFSGLPDAPQEYRATFKISGALTPTIDIDPNKKSENVIDLTKGNNLKVAILGDEVFDALQVNPDTVKFGPSLARPIRSNGQDYNHDGFADLILTFNLEETGIACEDVSAILSGEMYDGESLRGSDDITVQPCP
jgi:hypothetical protein